MAEDLLSRVEPDWISAAEVADIVLDSRIKDRETLSDPSIGLISRLLVEVLVVPCDLGACGSAPSDLPTGDANAWIVVEWIATSSTVKQARRLRALALALSNLR